MADSEENNNLNKIFMSSTIRSSKGTTKVIPNTAQNMYINQNDLTQLGQTSKGKKSSMKQSSSKMASNTSTISSLLQITGGANKSEKLKQITDNLDSESEIKSESNSESGSGSESESESDDDDEIDPDAEEIDPNDEPEDEYEAKFDEEDIRSEIGSDAEEEEEDEDEEKDNAEPATEYNDDPDKEKDIEGDDDKDDDCLYQYDELIDDRDTDKPPVQILKENRTTDPQMTHYEKIRLLGIRTKQIAMGAKVMVKYDGNMGAMELAKYELNNKTTPLIIKRPLPDNTYELWKVAELNIDEDDSTQIIEELKQSYQTNQNLYQI